MTSPLLPSPDPVGSNEATSTIRHKPAVSPTNDAEALRWLRIAHKAPCGDDACDSIYCYIAERLAQVDALTRAKDSANDDLRALSKRNAELAAELSSSRAALREAETRIKELTPGHTDLMISPEAIAEYDVTHAAPAAWAVMGMGEVVDVHIAKSAAEDAAGMLDIEPLFRLAAFPGERPSDDK